MPDRRCVLQPGLGSGVEQVDHEALKVARCSDWAAFSVQNPRRRRTPSQKDFIAAGR